MPLYNLHQHSLFSDGHEPPEAYIQQALKLGFTAIGFSEHSPLPFDNPFSLKESRVEEYINAVESLKNKYKGRIKIFRALEMDFVPGMSEDFAYWKERCEADYLIGSVHLVKPEGIDELWFTDGPDYKIYDKGISDFFDGDIKKAVRRFYKQTNMMIESQEFDVIGHFDKIKMHNRERFFSEEEKWYRDLLNETIDLIRQKNLIVEVNTRGLYKKRSNSLFPDGYALKQLQKLNIPILISSDAHKADEIAALFPETRNRLLEAGFQNQMYFENGTWKEIPLKLDTKKGG